MESPKYLIIITLIDGQNFALPDGLHDRVDATVFAEARFGNESILKSDPIKLTNSNPEFATELAWQLDKRSLHQLRVERKSIKLQVFMQTQERSKPTNRQNSNQGTNGTLTNESNATHKVELIGYTVIDIRSAQDRVERKFQWLPLLNPKFRKSSYNRPEVQLALTLSRIEENPNCNDVKLSLGCSRLKPDHQKKSVELPIDMNLTSSSHDSDGESLNEDRLYKTCLDFTMNSNRDERDEIIENDINIRSKDGVFYIYDTRNSEKATINDCDEHYRITVTIPFTSELELLVREPQKNYYFSVNLFGTSLTSKLFEELTSVEVKEVQFIVCTTHSRVLTTYFELNSSLVIKLHQGPDGHPIGIATIQLDQLCSLEAKRRTIEGIFALQSLFDNDIPSTVHPSIGASVVLEKANDIVLPNSQQRFISDNHIALAKEHFGDDIDEFIPSKILNDTHELTIGSCNFEDQAISSTSKPDIDGSKQDNHHFCFTIDLKNFSYTPNQRLIPTLRELVVRYSYPFFGYKDTITTDASIPISPTNSIIVSGFCEFNFATTTESLLTALSEIPLNLEVLTCDQAKRASICDMESVVATCNLNLAQTLNLSEASMERLAERPTSTTVSAPIHGMNGDEIGEIQIYLCLKDLGQPSFKFKSSVENLDNCSNNVQEKTIVSGDTQLDKQIETFISDAKSNIELWKEDCYMKLSNEMRKRESEKFSRLCQRFEAKEAKREQEFKKKMDELLNLEKRFKNSLAHLETLERRLTNNFEQMRTKDTLLETCLDTVDLKIAEAINDIKLEFERKNQDLYAVRYQRPNNDNPIDTRTITRVSAKSNSDASQARRSSLKNTTNTPGIPVPVRSSSLVRGPTEGSSTRFVKRPTGVVTTVINGTCTRSRSTRLNLSKETQEKLASLRREKAELLKRGCRPNDELIQEINSMIERLAC